MASPTRYSKGYKVRYRVYYPDGSDRVAFAYRIAKRDAEQLLGQASQRESITRQNALTPDTATPFQHWRLLTEADLQRWWPRRAGPLQYDAQALGEAYWRECQVRCTSAETIVENRRRAGKLLAEFGNLARLTEADVRAWQQARAAEVARKTVNLELDVLRQLVDLCQRFGWCEANAARAVRHLPWKVSRLPQALSCVQVQEVLTRAREAGAEAPPSSLVGQLYRLVVARIYFGLRRGELQHLLWSDTNGRQVFVQGKTLPDGRPWVPKDREARVIAYPGIERPIAVVFGEEPQGGYVFSPAADRQRPFYADYFTEVIRLVLKPLSPALTLHSLRHTFATWRLEIGESMARVQRLMGHADANTLMRYAHIEPDPLADLLHVLENPPGLPLKFPPISSSTSPPDDSDSP
jgi:site-specific recombinase XerD